MNKTQIVKLVVKFAVGAGTSKIAAAVIANNIQPEDTIAKIEVVSASVVVGMMASEATRKYTDAKIDEAIESWTELRTKIKEAKEAKA